MASYSVDLTCSICLTIFTDPVMLICGHSFCTECITLSLGSQRQCPQCRATVPAAGKCLLTNHTLKSLAEKEKQAKKQQKEAAERLCTEHEEKLKLFCVTDQQLACIICRDEERHEGHKFKPIKEAAASLRKELETFVQLVSGGVHVMEEYATTQKEVITQTREQARQLVSQISSQFEEMHQFLRKREDEIKNELKRKEDAAVEIMTESVTAIETALSESRELQRKMTSLLQITESDKFLQSWTEDSNTATVKDLVLPGGDKLQVVKTSLSLGPYESHLQFFVWKKMLQVIQPRAELLSLKRNDREFTVSDDVRSLLSVTPNYFIYEQINYKQYTSTFSLNEFTSGQHYWEIDLGKRNYWELGVQNHYLRYDGETFVASGQNTSTMLLSVSDTPRKIGIYMNLPSEELSFYDADTMTHIHTLSCSLVSIPVSAYFKIKYSEFDPNPVSVCWY